MPYSIFSHRNVFFLMNLYSGKIVSKIKNAQRNQQLLFNVYIKTFRKLTTHAMQFSLSISVSGLRFAITARNADLGIIICTPPFSTECKFVRDFSEPAPLPIPRSLRLFDGVGKE